MAVSAEEIAFLTDHFSDLGAITTRRMMGGLCVYADGVIFAIVGPDGRHYFKARDDLAEALAAEGASQWRYANEKTGRRAVMPYWTFPEAALDDPNEACTWARKSLAQAD
ncbi:MAG: TfoX/Sxy family protein [Pseudomonadota bacterium]